MTTEEHPKTKRWILIRAAINGAIAEWGKGHRRPSSRRLAQPGALEPAAPAPPAWCATRRPTGMGWGSRMPGATAFSIEGLQHPHIVTRVELAHQMGFKTAVEHPLSAEECVVASALTGLSLNRWPRGRDPALPSSALPPAR